MNAQTLLAAVVTALCAVLGSARSAQAYARICNYSDVPVLLTYLAPEPLCPFGRTFDTVSIGNCAIVYEGDATGKELYYHVQSDGREWTGDSQVWVPFGPADPSLDVEISGWCMPDPACPDAPIETCFEGSALPMNKWVPTEYDETIYLQPLEPLDP